MVKRVGHTKLHTESLSYYPPRSRWYTRILYELLKPFRNVCQLDAVQLKAPLSLGRLIPALAIPGYSFLALNARLYGWLCLAAYVLAAGVFFVRLGFQSGSVAFGLMISLHATSIIYLTNRWFAESRFLARLGLAFCALLALWGVVYTPAGNYTQRHWFMPVRQGDRVYVVKPGLDLRTLKRGEWVLHEIQFVRGEGVYVNEGYGIDPVLALPGDMVRYTQNAVEVNGQPYSRQFTMPASGDFQLPQNVWFIWPNIGITTRGRVNVSETIQEVALVPGQRIIGKPYKSWFGRRQWP